MSFVEISAQATAQALDVHTQGLDNLSNRKLWMLFKEVEHKLDNQDKLYRAISQELARRDQLGPDCIWRLPH